jgi:hypothetical protein
MNLKNEEVEREVRESEHDRLSLRRNTLRRRLSNDVAGLRTFFTLDDVEGDFVTFFEALITVFLDGAEMNEHVFAAIVPKKAIAFHVVKPLDCTLILAHRVHLLDQS